MADRQLVTQLTKVAFLIRLTSLLLVILSGELDNGLIMVVLLTVAASSAWGLWSTDRVVGAVTLHPTLVLGDILLASVVTLVVGTDTPALLFSLGTALLIGLLFEVPVTILLVTVLSSTYLVAAMTADSSARSGFLILPTAYVIIAMLGVVTRRLHYQAMAELQRVQTMERELARERERARIARDMHDTVSKTVRGVELAAAALPGWIDRDPETAKHHAASLQDAAVQAADEARRLLVELHDNDDTSLHDRLTRLVVEYQHVGLRLESDIGDLSGVSPTVARELSLVATEALENARRHAPHSAVRLDCHVVGTHVHLEIRDDGPGFDPASEQPGHFGVTGMRERAILLGGECDLRSRPGHGTTITVRAPITPTDRRGGHDD